MLWCSGVLEVSCRGTVAGRHGVRRGPDPEGSTSILSAWVFLHLHAALLLLSQSLSVPVLDPWACLRCHELFLVTS